MTKNKRTIRNAYERESFKVTPQKFVVGLFVLSMIMFVAVQLSTNTVLTPLGHTLASLNSEKNQLIEQNRELEQEIAKNSSITVITKYADKKLSLTKTDNNKTIYATPSTVTAMR